MKSCTSLLAAISYGMLAWAQGTSSPPKTPPANNPSSSTGQTSGPASTAGLKVRGPDAVAQQDPNRVVATINGKQITAQQAANMLKQIPEDQRRGVPSLANLLERVYMIDQFADQAEKLKLDQQSPWKERLQLDRTQVLAQAYMTQMGKNPSGVSGVDPQQYYNSHPAEFEQVKLSGVLIAFNAPGTPASGAKVTRTEPEALQKANDLEKKIKDGGDFSALARTDSDQQQSSVRGGDLGTYTIGDPNLPPDIKTAISKLQAGQVSEPIRVPGGYFILKLDSRTKLPFDQARASIVQKMEVDKYKIQVQDPDFFASSAPNPNLPSLKQPAPAQPPPQPKPPAQ
jgi:parvulin-like peptidyl-prolyl isomerase